MGRLNYEPGPSFAVPTQEPTDVSQLPASTEFVQNLIPPGVVLPYAGTVPPDGWLLCDGSPVSRTTYNRLFAAIGTTYGNGNGTTTFNLPDLRGEFIRGLDQGRGVDPGRTLGSAQMDALQNITGNFFVPTSVNPTADGAFAKTNEGSNAQSASNTGSRITFDASRVARTADETRSRNVALNFIIKAQ